jgi:hypothetical protein
MSGKNSPHDEPVYHHSCFEYDPHEYPKFLGPILAGKPDVVLGSRFAGEPKVTSKVARMGCRIYEVGISSSVRTYDAGNKIGWKDGVRAIRCILKYL